MRRGKHAQSALDIGFSTPDGGPNAPQHRELKMASGTLEINFLPRDKKPLDEAITFGSIEEVKRFVSEYFDSSVVERKPSEMPRPEDL
jgi:hypothetical protein